MRTTKLFVAALLALASTAAVAQEMPQMPAVPVDKDVRVGKLDNGLTYYIRHNNEPENKADFYIAQRVGSINEEDPQRGLAHFLEHMAFNGSDHFPGNGIIEYTRTLGVEFGRNLNAYTSVDQTVYNICDVPTFRQTALDSCLLILKDWSCGLTLADKDIDEERGVVHQEWQMRSSAMQRFYEQRLPNLFPGSKYGERLPIGLMDIIDNFKYQELRDYYHKWYRPDNQAIIVVGNVDVDHMEAEIKKLWAGVTVPADAAPIPTIEVPDNEQAIYEVFHDKEQQYDMVQVWLKSDVFPVELRPTVAYLMQDYLLDIVQSMLATRFHDLMLNPNAPFTLLQGDYGRYMGICKTKDGFCVTGLAKEGKTAETLTAIMTELKRVAEHGFTDSEYERAKSEYMSQIEKQWQNRDKQKNGYYVQQYVDNYLDNTPIPSLDDYYQTMQQLTAMLPSALVNQVAQEMFAMTDTNLVVTCLQQERDGQVYATADDLRQAVQAGRDATVEAQAEENLDQPLIEKEPKAGRVKSETANSQLGYKTLTLSNGARVILKKTDFKDDQIKLQAWAKGGQNAFTSADNSNLKVYDLAMEASRLGAFTSTQLQKKLAGKQVSVSKSLGHAYTYVNGETTPKDLETLMQLLYLEFTDNTKDTTAYNSYSGMVAGLLKNKNLQPEGVFQDSVEAVCYAHNPRFYSIHSEDLEQASYDRIIEMDRQLFANAGAFTFVFTGNFDEATLRPLIERYIASLPTAKTKLDAQPGTQFTYGSGEQQCHFKRQMDTPKAMLAQVWVSDKKPYTLKDDIYVDAVGQLLSMDLLRTIREENSAAYSVGAAGFSRQEGTDAYFCLQAVCPLDPAKAELADSLMDASVANALKGFSDDALQKVKENMLKNADDNARDNGYWLNVIQNQEMFGMDTHTTYKDIVRGMTAQDLTDFLGRLVANHNHKEIFMLPE